MFRRKESRADVLRKLPVDISSCARRLVLETGVMVARWRCEPNFTVERFSRDLADVLIRISDWAHTMEHDGMEESLAEINTLLLSWFDWSKPPSAVYQVYISYMLTLSISSRRLKIWSMRSLAGFVKMLAAMTGRLTPQALPSPILLGRYIYGTFLSSHRRGRWSRIAAGEVSAVRTMSSDTPRFRVFVA